MNPITYKSKIIRAALKASFASNRSRSLLAWQAMVDLVEDLCLKADSETALEIVAFAEPFGYCAETSRSGRYMSVIETGGTGKVQWVRSSDIPREQLRITTNGQPLDLSIRYVRDVSGLEAARSYVDGLIAVAQDDTSLVGEVCQCAAAEGVHLLEAAA